MTSEKAGLYVHVPFCVSKCPYCAFASVTDLSALPATLVALEKEIASRAEPTLVADSVHLGGGTPSLLRPADVGRILAALSKSFRIDPGAEVTLEANPGTVSPDSLRGFRREGVNRLVIGAQSFSREDLKFLGRIHVPAETQAAFEAARRAGFDNVGLDLIYGLPGRDPGHWTAQMDSAVALGPEHLSCYALAFEPGTPLRRRRDEGAVVPPGEEDARQAFLQTHRFLESRGYPFYEVSNFSREALHPSRHNLKYWTLAPTLGFGPSAHSFQPPVRRWNTASLAEYLRSMDGDRSFSGGEETLTASQMALEFLSLGLRTSRGVDLDRLERDLAPGFRSANTRAVERLRGEGLARVEGSFLRLTEEGLVIADRVPLLFDL